MFRALRRGGIGMVLMFFLITHMGVQVGYHSATDPSAEGLDNMTETLDSTVADARANATENVSGVGAAEARGYTNAILDTISVLVGSGVRFGYHHPTAAWWYLRVSPVTVLLGLGLYGYGTWREFKRGETPVQQ